MLLSSTLIAIFALSALINGGQIPVVDGVIGGVSSPGAHDFKNLARAASTPRTPGKLRVLENSGVCGGVIQFEFVAIPCYSHISQKLRLVSIRLPDMVTWLRIRASGL